jgi:hypothetical protein
MFQRKLELIRTLETLTLIKECCDLFNSFLDKNSTDKKKKTKVLEFSSE